MNLRRVRLAILFITVSLLLMAPRLVYPCGPVFSSPMFISPHQPERVDAYVGGQLGVPLRSYRSVYLFMAYRYLSGEPLTANEQKLATVPPPGISVWWGSPIGGETKPWLEARAAVPGLPPSPKFEMWKQFSDYQTIVNCTPDSFQTAAKTLLNLVARYGPNDVDVKEWIAGQDRVFVQCSGGNPQTFSRAAEPVSPLPTDVAASAPQWLKEDRAYQIAAANFYAGNFDEAHARFLQIASDGQSPWQPWGAYLAGRSLVRKATLNTSKPDDPYDPKVLAEAESQLKQVIADPKLQQVHEAARQVLGYVEFRLHPEQREAELGKLLAKRESDKNLAQDLKDFVLLLDKTDDPDSDMGRWIDAFRALGTIDPDVHEESVPQTKISPMEEWKKQKTLPWLVLAMASAKASDSDKQELLTAAQKVPHESPAYPTLVFHEARLTTPDRARSIIDDFLARHGRELPMSGRNLFLRERLDVAADFNDFLAHAQRQPVGSAAEGYGDEFQELCNAGAKSQPCKRAYFDEQAAKVMDLLPIADWLKATDDKHFDPELRRHLALATWSRAVLVQDWPAADQSARLLKQLMPESAKYLDPFLQATDPSAKKFAAAFAMLHWPGIQPSLSDLTIRFEPALDKLDQLRMNWWCTVDSGNSPEGEKSHQTVAEVSPEEIASRLLTKADQELGQKQHDLVTGTNGPDFLEPAVLAWAKTHPDDPRVPEALHLSITAGHLSCSTDRTASYSKQAFTLLHNRYANSDWAKKTPYWYK